MNPSTFTHILTLAAMLSFFTALAQEEKSPLKPATPSGAVARTFKNVGPDQFDKLRQSKTNVVLDVRTKKEYQEGHLPGAILIDFTEDSFAKEVAKLDTNKTYLVHCAAGGRSARACKKMEQLGFKNLYNLEGGLTGWQKAGKPVEK